MVLRASCRVVQDSVMPPYRVIEVMLFQSPSHSEPPERSVVDCQMKRVVRDDEEPGGEPNGEVWSISGSGAYGPRRVSDATLIVFCQYNL